MQPAGSTGGPQISTAPKLSQAEQTRKALDAKYAAERAAEKKKQLQEEMAEEAAKKERDDAKAARAKEMAVIDEQCNRIKRDAEEDVANRLKAATQKENDLYKRTQQIGQQL